MRPVSNTPPSGTHRSRYDGSGLCQALTRNAEVLSCASPFEYVTVQRCARHEKVAWAVQFPPNLRKPRRLVGVSVFDERKPIGQQDRMLCRFTDGLDELDIRCLGEAMKTARAARITVLLDPARPDRNVI